MEQKIQHNNESEKIPYKTPEIKQLGQLSQLIQGCSSGTQDSFPSTGSHDPTTSHHVSC